MMNSLKFEIIKLMMFECFKTWRTNIVAVNHEFYNKRNKYRCRMCRSNNYIIKNIQLRRVGESSSKQITCLDCYYRGILLY